jgi:hypothetical protein
MLQLGGGVGGKIPLDPAQSFAAIEVTICRLEGIRYDSQHELHIRVRYSVVSMSSEQISVSERSWSRKARELFGFLEGIQVCEMLNLFVIDIVIGARGRTAPKTT